MKVSELIEKLQYNVFSKVDTDKEITAGYASDLLSDVMGNSSEGNIWVTMQTHKNVVAVAALKELSAVIFTNSNVPSEESVEAANEENVLLLGTSKGTFEVCGEIYNLLESK